MDSASVVRRKGSAAGPRIPPDWLSEPDKDPVHLQELGRTREEASLRAFHRGRHLYVYLDLSGRGRHHCDCRESGWTGWGRRNRRPPAPLCRHVVAAAVREGRPDLLLATLLQFP